MNTDHIEVSIKLRGPSCFGREHSPHWYQRIDEELRAVHSPDFHFREHESGPEIIVFVAAGVSLVTSVINLIVSLLNARSASARQGDQVPEPVKLVVRKAQPAGKRKEVSVLELSLREKADAALVAKALNEAIRKLLDDQNRSGS